MQELFRLLSIATHYQYIFCSIASIGNVASSSTAPVGETLALLMLSELRFNLDKVH